jgi:hypothetical protein
MVVCRLVIWRALDVLLLPLKSQQEVPGSAVNESNEEAIARWINHTGLSLGWWCRSIRWCMSVHVGAVWLFDGLNQMLYPVSIGDGGASRHDQLTALVIAPQQQPLE